MLDGSIRGVWRRGNFDEARADHAIRLSLAKEKTHYRFWGMYSKMGEIVFPQNTYFFQFEQPWHLP
jgi:hypothetical protein